MRRAGLAGAEHRTTERLVIIVAAMARGVAQLCEGKMMQFRTRMQMNSTVAMQQCGSSAASKYKPQVWIVHTVGGCAWGPTVWDAACLLHAGTYMFAV